MHTKQSLQNRAVSHLWFAACGVILASLSANWFSSEAALSSTYATGRKCYDVSQKLLTDAEDPAVPYFTSGTWLCVDTKTGKVENKPTAKTACSYYWSEDGTPATIHGDVYCIKDYCQYGTNYCGGWDATVKSLTKTQPRMICHERVSFGITLFGWFDGQGALGLPSDPGNKLDLSSVVTCPAPNEWEWSPHWQRKSVPDSMRLQPVAAQSSSLESSSSASSTVSAKSASTKKKSLLQLLKKKK